MDVYRFAFWVISHAFFRLINYPDLSTCHCFKHELKIREMVIWMCIVLHFG